MYKHKENTPQKMALSELKLGMRESQSHSEGNLWSQLREMGSSEGG